ncbi:MAG TPA: vitamin K epoxide reductase family protein [Nitrososphaerales archaeon]|nr:vitamin K epoxide reductase family protein [Nitrososphaerales archaeon]
MVGSQEQPSPKAALKRDLVLKSYLVLAAIGIAVSIFHAWNELTASFQYCNVNPQVSCLSVFESGQTSLFGIPYYVFGLVWFPLALILGFLAVNKMPYGITLNGSIILPFLMIGNLFTVFLWYLELGVIGAICPVCVTLYVINYAMTGLAVRSIL